MSLSAIQKLTLGQELSQLMQEAKSAPGLRRLEIGKKIVEVMMQLGFGVTTPEPVPEPGPSPDPVAPKVPEVVTEFLSGAFVNASQMDFIDKLRAISGYVGEFLTLDQAKEQTVNWVATNGYGG